MTAGRTNHTRFAAAPVDAYDDYIRHTDKKIADALSLSDAVLAEIIEQRRKQREARRLTEHVLQRFRRLDE